MSARLDDSATEPSNSEAEQPLALEIAWPLVVAAGAIGSWLGLQVGWPAFAAAFATAALWGIERRAQAPDRPPVALGLTLAWLVAIVLTVGAWAVARGPLEVEGSFPGALALTELMSGRPFVGLSGMALLALGGAYGAGWAQDSFASWTWALLAGYLAVVAGDAARPLVEDGAGEALAVLRRLAPGPALALAGGVVFRGFRTSRDRRYAWAASALFLAATVSTAVS